MNTTVIIKAACALAIVAGLVLAVEHQDRARSDRATLAAIMADTAKGLDYTATGATRR